MSCFTPCAIGSSSSILVVVVVVSGVATMVQMVQVLPPDREG